MINPLLKRLVKEKKEDIAHTSAFAEVQNRGGFGSASVESFEKRREIDKQRKMIGGYRDARVVSDRGIEAWKIRQEKRQLGGDDGGNSGGVSGFHGELRSETNNASTSSRPLARKNPGISR